VTVDAGTLLGAAPIAARNAFSAVVPALRYGRTASSAEAAVPPGTLLMDSDASRKSAIAVS
jgi:hypothetical protein